jgi:hypothetical protein|eukprot:COSAG01_NODE_709_length_14119_cov_107.401213_2_plen_44_part_00
MAGEAKYTQRVEETVAATICREGFPLSNCAITGVTLGRLNTHD